MDVMSIEDIQRIRMRLVDRGLYIFGTLGFIALLGSLSRSLQIGWQNIMYFHIGIYGIIIGGLLLRRRLSFRIRAALALGSLLALGIVGLFKWGLMGFGLSFLFTLCVFTTMVLGTRAGIFAMSISLIVLIILSIGVETGLISFGFDPERYLMSMTSWLNAIFGTLVFAGLLVVGLGHMNTKMEKTIEILDRYASKIEEMNKDLEEEILQNKITKEELQRSEERLRMVLDATSDGVWDHNLKNGISYISPKYYSTLGFRPDEYDTSIEAWKSMVHPSDKTTILSDIENHHKGLSDQIILKYRIQNKFGKWIWLLSRGKVVEWDESGEPVRFLGTVEDITEHKNSEQEKKRLDLQLRQSQKMESVGTMAGGIAHEFNNILGIIIGNTELALDDMKEKNPARECLKEVLSASFRARDVVKQILSFAHQSPFERKPIMIHEIIKESMKLMRATIPSTIDIRKNILCGSEMIMADPTEINQIVMNLCTNSVHAMGVGPGVLEVGLEAVELDDIGATQYLDLKPGSFVKLTIRDTGHGIRSDIMDRIFDPYFTTKDVNEGLGIGLAVVYNIVKKCNGGIRLRSNQGEGTLVEVLLPVFKEKIKIEEKTKEVDFHKGSERILFIDDERSIVRIVTHTLKRLGYDVRAGTDPIKELEFFRSDPSQFDLIITDLTMPQMTGDQLARELIKIRPDIPIILCTGYNERVKEEQIKKIGIKAMAYKPFRRKDLARMIRNMLDDEREKSEIPFSYLSSE